PYHHETKCVRHGEANCRQDGGGLLLHLLVNPSADNGIGHGSISLSYKVAQQSQIRQKAAEATRRARACRGLRLQGIQLPTRGARFAADPPLISVCAELVPIQLHVTW